jgi:hypothetical protein
LETSKLSFETHTSIVIIKWQVRRTWIYCNPLVSMTSKPRSNRRHSTRRDNRHQVCYDSIFNEKQASLDWREGDTKKTKMRLYVFTDIKLKTWLKFFGSRESGSIVGFEHSQNYFFGLKIDFFKKVTNIPWSLTKDCRGRRIRIHGRLIEILEFSFFFT